MRSVFILFCIFLSFCNPALCAELDSLQNLLPHRDGKSKIDILNRIASLLNSSALGLEEALTADSLSKSISYHEGEAMAQANLGFYFLNIGEFEQAKEHLSFALELFKGRTNSDQIFEVFNGLAFTYSHDNNYLLALKNAQAHLEYANKYNHKTEVVRAYVNLGEIYYLSTGDLDKAKQYLHKAQKLLPGIGRGSIRYNNFLLLGQVYQFDMSLDSSMVYYKQAWEELPFINEEVRKANHTSQLKLEMGWLWYEKGEIDKAKTLIEESLQMASVQNHTHLLLSANADLAIIYFTSNNPSKGLHYAYRAIPSAVKFQDFELLGELYQEMRNYFKNINEEDSIWNYTNLLEEIRDSLLYLGQTNTVNEWQLKTQIEEAEAQFIEHKQRDSIILFSGIVILILLGLLCVFLFYYYKWLQRKRKQEIEILEGTSRQKLLETQNLRQEKSLREAEQLQLQDQLDKKNIELASQVEQLKVKNKLLQTVKEELKESTSRLTRHDKQKLARLRQVLYQDALIEEDWKSIEYHFEQIHPQFFQKLKSRFPNLSGKDMRHCAFIRINLKPNEIASLMQIDNQSVLKARYRLRKKMNLGRDLDLNTTIKSI